MAKKSKPVKPASPKGKKTVSKKAVTKPASPKGRKPIAKKVVKKAAVKKAVIKPAAAKGKKAPVKKPAPKKAVAKPASPKGGKPIAKKIIAIKKPVPVKAVPAKVVKPALPAAKKVVAKKKAARVASPIQLPDAIVENAANINKPMMVPGDGLNASPGKTEDPIKTFDKNVFNKATAKGDPHNNMHLSSKPKNAIKPSGKKPLW